MKMRHFAHTLTILSAISVLVAEPSYKMYSRLSNKCSSSKGTYAVILEGKFGNILANQSGPGFLVTRNYFNNILCVNGP
jgi:hypothetical protein